MLNRSFRYVLQNSQIYRGLFREIIHSFMHLFIDSVNNSVDVTFSHNPMYVYIM